MIFERNLEDNLFALSCELKNKTYHHSEYSLFFINDPKHRRIHKATVRDRVVHHAVYRILYPIFDPSLIFDSYSCRLDKGTHKAVKRLTDFTRKVSHNHTRPCFVLKCDIKKFFASVDHSILLEIIRRRIKDKDVIWLIGEIIASFPRLWQESLSMFRKGLPIGNLTSQLFANIYMNEFDRFVKHKLIIKKYIRYTDDFVMVSADKTKLIKLLPQLRWFLREKLKLEVHPHKISIRKLSQGIDFLGYVILPFHCRVRTKTKRRTFKKLKHKVEEYKAGLILKYTLEQSLHSSIGILKHANCYKLQNKLKNQFWLWLGG